jgi:hypothetical protein
MKPFNSGDNEEIPVNSTQISVVDKAVCNDVPLTSVRTDNVTATLKDTSTKSIPTSTRTSCYWKCNWYKTSTTTGAYFSYTNNKYRYYWIWWS